MSVRIAIVVSRFNDFIAKPLLHACQAELKAKLDNHLSTVYVVNNNNQYKLDKPYLRIANWNIHRGATISEIKEILTNSSAYQKKNIVNVKP